MNKETLLKRIVGGIKDKLDNIRHGFRILNFEFGISNGNRESGIKEKRYA